jgi:hypothetical protein
MNKAEREALHAVGRGATELRMAPRVRLRLLALGLISASSEGWRLTDAGRRALQSRRTNQWY